MAPLRRQAFQSQMRKDANVAVQSAERGEALCDGVLASRNSFRVLLGVGVGIGIGVVSLTIAPRLT